MWPVVQTSSVLGQIFDEGIHGKSSAVLRGGLIEIKWDFPQIKALGIFSTFATPRAGNCNFKI